MRTTEAERRQLAFGLLNTTMQNIDVSGGEWLVGEADRWSVDAKREDNIALMRDEFLPGLEPELVLTLNTPTATGKPVKVRVRVLVDEIR